MSILYTDRPSYPMNDAVSDLVSSFNFYTYRGAVDLDAIDISQLNTGDVFTDLASGDTYLWINNTLAEIAKLPRLQVNDTNADSTVTNEVHEIKCTHCTRCGAPLPIHTVDDVGIVKCAFCDSFSYVW